MSKSEDIPTRTTGTRTMGEMEEPMVHFIYITTYFNFKNILINFIFGFTYKTNFRKSHDSEQICLKIFREAKFYHNAIEISDLSVQPGVAVRG